MLAGNPDIGQAAPEVPHPVEAARSRLHQFPSVCDHPISWVGSMRREPVARGALGGGDLAVGHFAGNLEAQHSRLLVSV